jgi:hypothetical protein
MTPYTLARLVVGELPGEKRRPRVEELILD